MMTLLARRPAVSALVTWLLLTSVTRGTHAATSDVQDREWPVWVLGGFVLYGAFALWITTTEKFASAGPAAVGTRKIGVRMAVAITPVLLSCGLAFEGLPSWAINTALGISGLFLAVVAALARREQERASLVDE